METTATIASDQLLFSCPSCKSPYSLSAGLPAARQPLFPVACSGCGAGFSVRNPSMVSAPAPLMVAREGGAASSEDSAAAPATAAPPRFCVKCGSALTAGQAFCPSCGAALASGSLLASELGQRIATSSADAFRAVRRLATDPVSGLAGAYDALGESRAQAAGVALCALFAIVSATGILFGERRWFGTLLTNAPEGAVGFLKLFLALLILPAVMTAITFILRKMLRAAPGWTADVFTCGAALTPMALVTLLSGVVAASSVELIVVLFTFGWIYLLIMLFAGISRLGALTERTAAPVLPVVVLLTGWLSKVIFTALT